MVHALMIQGELRLPAAFMHDKHMQDIEHDLQAAGLMPVEAQSIRWRMDHDSPGGYILTFTYLLDLAV